MSKIVVINDTHFGHKNSSQLFLDYQQQFFAEQFFPYCKENNITQLLHLGDIFDNRKHITVKTLNFLRITFLDKLKEYGIHMHIIPGNHDTAYKNTIELNSISEVLQQYKDEVTIYMKPTVVEFDSLKIGLVPWIANNNQEECFEFIKTSNASILGGHFAISGFKYIANSNTKSDGLNESLFNRYDTVLSGHFHTKSHHGNITYLGAQFQFTWSDVDDKKYFHVIDTETREMIPVENQRKMFRKYYYDDTNATKLEDIINKSYNKDDINKSYIRVVVTNKRDYHIFDQYIEYIKSFDPFDLTIVENFDDLFKKDDDDAASFDIIEDTSDLLDSYVENDIHTHLDKDRIKKYLHQLYIEAQNQGTV